MISATVLTGFLGSGKTTLLKRLLNEAHGMKIVDDTVYTTDRPDSVAVAFTLDGRPLLVLGSRVAERWHPHHDH